MGGAAEEGLEHEAVFSKSVSADSRGKHVCQGAGRALLRAPRALASRDAFFLEDQGFSHSSSRWLLSGGWGDSSEGAGATRLQQLQQISLTAFFPPSSDLT